MKNETYIGDGIYTSITDDDVYIVITTGSHMMEEAENIIYMEDTELRVFLQWLKKNKPEVMKTIVNDNGKGVEG